MNPIFLILLLAVFAVAVYFFNEKMKKENPKSTTKPKTDTEIDVEIDSKTDKPKPKTEPKTDTEIDAKTDSKTDKPKTNPKTISSFANRKGYDDNFVKTTKFKIKLEDLLKNHLADLPPLKVSTGKMPDLLLYHHFSIAMHRERKMPLLTAVNIDGTQTKDLNRASDSWSFDPRLSKEYQTEKEIYAKNDLDLGHLVRRLDPVWGENYLEANEDTFHLTVCAPQHKKLNRVTWLGLEDFLLKNTDNEDLKASVFSGPVFSEKDIDYRGIKVPLQFWKMAAIIKNDGTPSVSAYLLSHEKYLGDLAERGLIGDTGFGEYKTYQISLEKLQELTNLNLDSLLKYDPIQKERGLTASKPIEIKGFGDIQL